MYFVGQQTLACKTKKLSHTYIEYPTPKLRRLSLTQFFKSMPQLRILSIDPGVKNLGYAYVTYDQDANKIIDYKFGVITLTEKKVDELTLNEFVNAVALFMEDKQKMFERAHMILIEEQAHIGVRQLRRCEARDVGFMIASRFPSKCHWQNASAIKRKLKLATGSNASNKKEVEVFVRDTILKSDTWSRVKQHDLTAFKRSHDICDAILYIYNILKILY